MKKIAVVLLVVTLVFVSACGRSQVKGNTSTAPEAVQERNELIAEPVVMSEEAKVMPAMQMTRAKKEAFYDMDMVAASEPSQGFVKDDGNTEEYGVIAENDFLTSIKNPLSTFSIDVDKASYSNVRRFINSGSMPYRDAVRIEEMINYFDYSYPKPQGDVPFSVTAEYSVCPWNKDNRLVLIGLKGRDETAGNTASSLTFLIDVSGSMEDPNKLPLLKKSLKMLVNNLSEADRVAIVVYANAEGVVLPSTSAKDKNKINAAIENLSAGGSTAGGAGIALAYKIASENYIKGGNNRIILATDGDFNVGVSSTSELVKMVEEKRKEGVFLSVLGFGDGNLKDYRMKEIANKGNGEFYYIDNILEAKKVFTDELTGTLYTIAKDVKIQVEFNPAKVASYRLVGYEDRKLNREDFDDDKKDAGEMGAGHTVTALYEIVLEKSQVAKDTLKYQTTSVNDTAVKSDEVAAINLRYKRPDGDTSVLVSKILKSSEFSETPRENIGFASAVAQYGMLLRDSKYKGSSTYKEVIEMAKKYKGDDKYGYKSEFIQIVEKTQLISN